MVELARAPDGEPVPLAELVEGCLELARAELAAVVMVAETSGLMGAALRRSRPTSLAGERVEAPLCSNAGSTCSNPSA